jgi:hypothetical protein
MTDGVGLVASTCISSSSVSWWEGGGLEVKIPSERASETALKGRSWPRELAIDARREHSVPRGKRRLEECFPEGINEFTLKLVELYSKNGILGKSVIEVACR